MLTTLSDAPELGTVSCVDFRYLLIREIAHTGGRGAKTQGAN